MILRVLWLPYSFLSSRFSHMVGKVTAAMCARLGLRCVVVIGADDASAQEKDVLEMKWIGTCEPGSAGDWDPPGYP
jgi:hypothetical protein